MGLSPFLADTYRRYKKGTETFVQWLGSTARLTGVVDDLFDGYSEEKTAAGRRKNDKNRKSPCQPPKEYTLPAQSFGRLARAIASLNVPIPTSILTILADVVKERRDCASWYAANQASDIAQESKKAPSTTGRPQKQEFDQAIHNNMFEHLKLEEPADNDQQPQSSFPNAPNGQSDMYKIEQGNEDISFAIYCFIKDSNDLRHLVQRTWAEYRTGTTSLETAAHVTNAAIKVIEKLNDQFQSAFPNFDRHTRISHFITRGCNPLDSNPGQRDITQSRGYDLKGKTFGEDMMVCERTTQLLHVFHRMIEKKVTFGQLLKHIPLSADEVVLFQCLYQMYMLSCFFKADYLELEDQVFRAVWQMWHASEHFTVLTWHVFAIQIFLETRRELGRQALLGVKSLNRYGHWLRNAYGRYYSLEDWEERVVFHSLCREDMLKKMEYVEARAIDDTFGDVIQRFREKYRKECDFGPFFLLSNHPAYCGMIMHHLMVRYHLFTTEMAGSTALITATAHLYNAAQQSGLLSSGAKWTDMEYIIQIQGEKNMFVGKRPDEITKYSQHLYLALGERLAELSTTAKLRATKKSSQTSPMVKVCSRGRNRDLICLSKFAEYSVTRSSRLSPANGNSRAADDIVVMAELLSKDVLNAETPSQLMRELPKDNEYEHSISTTVQTLSTFKVALEKDRLALRFDVGALNLRCLKMLRVIQQDCVKKSPKDFPPGIYNDPKLIVGVVVTLLEHFSPHAAFTSRRVHNAVNLLSSLIQKEKNAEVLKALARAEAWKGNTTVDDEEIPTVTA